MEPEEEQQEIKEELFSPTVTSSPRVPAYLQDDEVLETSDTPLPEKYGYLNSNGTSLTNNIKDAITRFQETFGLQVTGYENEETLKLMDTPRCGNSDEGIAPFSVNPLVKWNSTRVTWNMIGSGIQYANIVERAFSLYSKHSALEIRRSYSNPTIMVVISPKKHVAYYLKSACSYDFDGPGGVLGHAFLPRPWLNQSDIHLDFEEDWDFTMNIPAPEKTSFFTVMVPRNRPCSRSSAFVCVTIRNVSVLLPAIGYQQLVRI
ncbi:collagenase 3-like [Homalodisca vitripennis]|uniref:collagenase 3-like n=1 Tax=Homalodisca vitripennis TaxID=197043 RepID=UPI001EE9B475|nr:collagenase 3-like [Homalodisca vitripennis]